MPNDDMNTTISASRVPRRTSAYASPHRKRTFDGIRRLHVLCGLLLCCAFHGKATTYVISTDGLPLTADHMAALGASSGVGTPGYVFFSPTMVGSINGTPIYFGGYGPNSAVFGIAGDLNLSGGDQIIGVGKYFLDLEVGNNAVIPAGANITVQGWISPNGSIWNPGDKIFVKSPMAMLSQYLKIMSATKCIYLVEILCTVQIFKLINMKYTVQINGLYKDKYQCFLLILEKLSVSI